MDSLLEKLKGSKVLMFIFLPIVVILAVLVFLKNNNLSNAKEEMKETEDKSDKLKKEEVEIKIEAKKLSNEAEDLGKRANAVEENRPILVEDEVDEDWHKKRK